ncbi:acyl carrier protein [Nonomuraea sp. NPDC004297]
MAAISTLRTVLTVAETVFGTKVDADDNFFSVGGDSVSAVELIARLHEAFDREIDPEVILESDTFAEMAESLHALRMNESA